MRTRPTDGAKLACPTCMRVWTWHLLGKTSDGVTLIDMESDRNDDMVPTCCRRALRSAAAEAEAEEGAEEGAA